jgi:hypothetical protein
MWLRLAIMPKNVPWFPLYDCLGGLFYGMFRVRKPPILRKKSRYDEQQAKQTEHNPSEVNFLGQRNGRVVSA